MLLAGQVACPGTDEGRAHFRVWATLSKLTPKSVEFGSDQPLDPLHARSLLIQFADRKQACINQKDELVFGSHEPGCRALASVIMDGDRVRFSPRRLLGTVGANTTHTEVISENDKKGKMLAKANPQFTVVSWNRVEIRAAT